MTETPGSPELVEQGIPDWAQISLSDLILLVEYVAKKEDLRFRLDRDPGGVYQASLLRYEGTGKESVVCRGSNRRMEKALVGVLLHAAHEL